MMILGKMSDHCVNVYLCVRHPTPFRLVTHIDIQDLIGGTLSQEGLSGGAGDFIGSSVSKHSAHALVLPWTVDGPVPIDDGTTGTATQSCSTHIHTHTHT